MSDISVVYGIQVTSRVTSVCALQGLLILLQGTCADVSQNSANLQRQVLEGLRSSTPARVLAICRCMPLIVATSRW